MRNKSENVKPTSDRLLWLKFHPGDWQSDLLLRSCSIGARGLWVELLSIMHQSERRGYLLIAGKVPKPAVLAIACGVTREDLEKFMDELAEAGVFSVTEDGIIYSRRMVRDEYKSGIAKEKGKKGGNPRLKAQLKPEDKPKRLETRGKRLEARDQNLEARGALKAVCQPVSEYGNGDTDTREDTAANVIHLPTGGAA